MLFGRPVDFSNIRSVGGLRSSEASGLSGGQMQRLAVYVTVFLTFLSLRHDMTLGADCFDIVPVRSCALCRRRSLP